MWPAEHMMTILDKNQRHTATVTNACFVVNADFKPSDAAACAEMVKLQRSYQATGKYKEESRLNKSLFTPVFVLEV